MSSYTIHHKEKWNNYVDQSDSDSGSDVPEVSESEDPKWFNFQQNHPLYEIYHVHFNKSSTLVLNFVGGSLPRCDLQCLLYLHLGDMERT